MHQLLKIKVMVITNEKITVTEQMMFDMRLARSNSGGEIGIPFSSKELEPIRWKRISNLINDDFIQIEEFFLNLKDDE